MSEEQATGATVANPDRGEVALEVDGKTYILRIRVAEIRSLERMFEKKFQGLITMLSRGMGVDDLTKMVTVGLSFHNKLKVSEVEDIVFRYGVNRCAEAIFEAVVSAFPDLVKRAEGKEQGRPSTGTSSDSSPSRPA